MSRNAPPSVALRSSVERPRSRPPSSSGSAARGGSSSLAAAPVVPTAPSMSPAISSRCARTASKRWFPRVASTPSEDREARRGPVRHARGDRPVERHDRVVGHPFQEPVQRQDLGPLGVGCARRPVVDGGDGGLELVLADAATADRGVEQRRPSAMLGRSQRPRSWSASGIGSPSASTRAGRRASISSISASSPATSGSSGSWPWTMRRAGSPRRTGRLAGAAPAAAGVALVEDQVEHVEHGPDGRRLLVGEGSRNGTPDALIVRFAREIRWAIVASGTRKALAIWAVVSPPTARSVRRSTTPVSARDGSTGRAR